jgi:Na+-translocating ferredoxin:NAD+ oxidoreductase RNF subunit RnfB
MVMTMTIALPLLVTAAAIVALCTALSYAAGVVRRSYYFGFDQIRRALPSLDCGVCGHERCVDFATAVASGNAGVTGCVPGGPKTAHAIADIMGTVAELGEPVIAAVHCKGGRAEVRERARYRGIADCHAALLTGNGTTACVEGCLGLASCVRACPFGALAINGNGVAVVDRHQCTGCGACVAACPRNLLALIPHVHKIYLACSNHDSGDRVTSYCTTGCTACEKCVAATPSGAVSMRDNLPVLDYFTPNENFVAAVYSCPSKCFVDLIKARPKANIDTKCDGCAECVAVCPVAGAITGTQGKRHAVKKELCIGCGRCLNSCHMRAISLWGSLGYDAGSRKVSSR